MTLSGTECVDMKNGAIREIGTYFFYNQKTWKWKLRHIFGLQEILGLWETRNLSINAIAMILRTFAMSKIVHFVLAFKKLSDIISKMFLCKYYLLWKESNCTVKATVKWDNSIDMQQ